MKAFLMMVISFDVVINLNILYVKHLQRLQNRPSLKLAKVMGTLCSPKPARIDNIVPLYIPAMIRT